MKLNKTGSIGVASVLPKMEDLKRMRPIVSYANFIGKLAESQHAASLIEKNITMKWKTFNMTRTENIKNLVKELNSKYRDTKNLMFLEMDIQDQFTNLDKQEVITKKCARNTGRKKEKLDIDH